MEQKEFNNAEILNIITYFDELDKDIANGIPLKTHWLLKKNLDKLKPFSQSFLQFRDEQIEYLQKKWFDEEHSDEIERPKLNDAGNPVVNDGIQETEKVRQIKPEFIEQYQHAADDINKKLLDIASEKNTVDIITLNMDEFVENLPENTTLDFDTINMMSFMSE